jgi:hypothetical protein
MKKIFVFVFLLVLISLKSFSQGNLQFNQVLTYSGILPAGSSLSPSYTVPSGKVWKIEYHTLGVLYLNSAYVHDLDCPPNTGCAGNTAPIWLKAGDVIYCYAYVAQYGQYHYAISIIEFNIVP